MKICFLSSMHTPLDKRVFDKEARSLAKAGFQVVHLAPSDELLSPTLDGVTLEVYPGPRGLWQRCTQLLTLYRRGAEIDADCYHCNEVDSWVVGVALKLRRRKLVVFDVHEHYPSVFGEQRLPRWLRPVSSYLIRLLFRVLTPLTQHIVLAKQSVASDFPQPEKHVLVQNFTPLAAMRERPASTDTSQTDRPLKAIHLGLFSRARGWPQLLSALEQVPDLNLTVEQVGQINDGSESEFQETLRINKLSDRVEVIDWLPFNEAFRRVCDADIGLVLFQPGIQNHVFAMPHKMFDYMLAGLPVIAPAFAEEVSQIIRDADCGLTVDTSEPDAIANALRRLAEDRKLADRLGSNGRRAVLEKYNWETEALKLIAMYQRLQSERISSGCVSHRHARSNDRLES